MTDPKNFPEVALAREGSGGSTLPATAAFPASGKPKRKPIPVKVQVALAILQADGLTCPLCRNRLVWDDPRVLEHMIPRATKIALGQDPDDIADLAYVHKICAALKTNGTPATCASGDLHKIAKGKRLATARAVHDAVKRGEHVRPASRIKGRGFSKHPTLKVQFGTGKAIPR